MSEPNTRKTVKCPECRSIASLLLEVWTEHYIVFETTERGLWDGKDGQLKTSGRPDHVVGVCHSCGHRWRLRGVRQIYDIKETP